MQGSPAVPPPAVDPARIALAAEHAAHLSAEDRRVIRICLALLGVMATGSLVGVAFSLYLVEEAPLLLVALSPLGRHVVLAVPNADPLALLAVGVTRRLCFFTACFYLGRALGPVGLVWLESKAQRAARWVRLLERLFQRYGAAMVLLFCGPTIATLAGIARMRAPLFAVLATLSLFFRIVILISFGEILQAPIERFLEWIDEYRLPGTLALVTGILAWQLWQRRARPAAS